MTQHGPSTGRIVSRWLWRQDMRPSDQRKAPGPVERTLLHLGVTNPDARSQATALDRAAEQLILDHTDPESAQPERDSRSGMNKSTMSARPASHLTVGDTSAAAIVQARLRQRESEAEIEP